MSGASLFERGRRLQLSSRENGNLAAVFEAAPNLLAARSTARFSPYMVPVSRAHACVSEMAAIQGWAKFKTPPPGLRFSPYRVRPREQRPHK